MRTRRRFRGRSLLYAAMAAVVSFGGTAAVVYSAGGAAHAVADGQVAAGGDYPFAAALTMPAVPEPDGTTRASGCSAALVAPRWLASVGHCFRDVDGNRVSGPVPHPVIATIGRERLSGAGGVQVNVVRVVQAPGVDFALAELEKPVANIVPIEPARSAPRVGDTVRMLGWGATNGVADLANRTDVLRTGLWRVEEVAPREVFTRGFSPSVTTSACPFDSGAPFVTERPDGKRLLVAVEVGGPSCPHSGLETTTRIDVLAGWIEQQIG